MKYVHEYRNSELMRALLRSLRSWAEEPVTLMEICGGQTHAIVRYGIDCILPDSIRLVHGPGCPVCVTSEQKIDTALAIARREEVIFCSYGDMLRVPGSEGSLLEARAQGADLRVLYSAQELLPLAMQNPDREIVFFAIGFETTAPAHAYVLQAARRAGIRNLSVLTAHVLVPPAMRRILSDPESGIQGFLAAGHVCCITGYEAYHELARQHAVPIAVTGFEPLDILQGILCCVQLVREGKAVVVNPYARAVREAGNSLAMAAVREVFEVYDAHWRGIGIIPSSGLRLAPAYQEFDAESKFALAVAPALKAKLCRAGEIMLGRIKPHDCPHFGKACRPEHPLGAPMVSSEGACAAYFHLRHAFKEPTA